MSKSGTEEHHHRAQAGRLLPDVLVVLCLTGLVLLFFWRFITPKVADRVAFPSGDFTDQFYAWRMYLARELAAGHLPLWSPYYNSGHPFQADPQAAVFYPLGLAMILLAARNGTFPLSALHWEAFLHFWLAGTFTYFFVKRLLARRQADKDHLPAAIARRAPALVAAVTFTFGGYLTSYPPLRLAILETVTWLPLALLCLDLAAESGTIGPHLAAGAVLAVAFLAGHPQTFLLVLYASVAYYAFVIWATRQPVMASAGHQGISDRYAWRRSARHLGLLGLTLATYLGLSAVQLFPSLEYAARSTRASLGYGEASRGMPPLDILQIIFPGFVSAFASPIYVGVLPLWLAITAVIARRDRWVIFWAALALVALLVSLGGYSFLYNLFYLFAPGFAFVRGQRAASIVSFSLAVLAGHGAHLLLHSLPRSQKAAFLATHRLLAWAPLLGLLVTLAFFYATRSLANPSPFLFLVDRAALMTLLFLLAAAVGALRLWGRLKGFRLQVLAVVLVLFDLFTINWRNNQGPAKEPFPVTPLIQAIQGSPYRVDSNALPGHFGVAYGLQDVRGISPLRIQEYDDLLRTLPEERLWALLNVHYLIAKGRVGAQELHKEGETVLYRLAEPLPRAWIAGRMLVEPSRDRTLALLASPNFDLRETVILVEPPPLTPSPEAEGTARVTIYNPEYIALEARTSAAAFLVISEVYFPGWRAKVDGQEARLYRADHALRAVFLPAGEHRVELLYEPLAFRLGALVSLGTLLGLGLFAMLVGYKAWAKVRATALRPEAMVMGGSAGPGTSGSKPWMDKGKALHIHTLILPRAEAENTLQGANL